MSEDSDYSEDICPKCGRQMEFVAPSHKEPGGFQCAYCEKAMMDELKWLTESKQVELATDDAIRKTEGFFSEVLTKPKRGPVLFINPIIIGFDSEFQGDILLTIQFASGLGNSKMYEIKDRVLSIEKFVECLKDFTRMEKGTIYLITYFGFAEARYWADLYRDFKMFMQIGNSLSYYGELGSFKCFFKDLYGLYPMALKKVGQAIGMFKESLEGVGGKPESYWKERMSELFEKFPTEYEVYARTDAEIALTAFNNLRDRYRKLNGIEILNLPTMPSIAFQDFKTNYLSEDAAPSMDEFEPRPNRLNAKTGEWEEQSPKRITVFDGDLNVRRFAGLASWGAINSLFWFGYKKSNKPFAQYLDVLSLYVAAAILQPLSNARTNWRSVSTLKQIKTMEGFARIRFKFKDGELHPNLAQKSTTMPDTAIFALEGTTTETFSQIRQAVRFGAKITEIKGYGFKPTKNEIDHDLGKFLRPMLEAKTQAEKGSMEYQNAKLQMVSLIGRFQLKTQKYDLGSKIRHLKRSGLSLSAYVSSGRTKEYRPKEKGGPMIAGKGFCPEWSTLILGRARSIIAGICHIGGCYHISTDGGIFDFEFVPKILQSPEVKALRRVGSDLRPEGNKENPEALIDELFISRTRFYALWFNGVMVHSAHQGIHPTGSFEKILRTNIEARSPVIIEAPQMSLSKIRDVLDGKAKLLSEPMLSVGKISHHRDYKEKFEPITEESLSNPYAMDQWTKPQQRIEDAYRWKKVTRNEKLSPTEKVRLLSDLSLRYPTRTAPDPKYKTDRERLEARRKTKRDWWTKNRAARQL
jgi:hypothetical protein